MRPQLLVIEDDPDSLELLLMLLETCGFAATGANQTAVARDTLSRIAFDAVLADFMVDSRDPVISWTMIDDLVRIAKPSPVGLLTGWPIKAEQIAAHQLAFAIPKPCSSELLLAQLSEVLDVPALSAAEEKVLRDYFACLAAGNYDAVVALCTEDVAYHLPSADPRIGHTVHGRDALRELSRKTFAVFRSPVFEIESIRALPRGAVVRYTGTWTDESGASQSLPGAVLFVLAGLQIAEIGVRVNLTPS
ncbi:MAG: nuclear transport factor 2 family protein [Kofleriaceae bacterium]